MNLSKQLAANILTRKSTKPWNQYLEPYILVLSGIFAGIAILYLGFKAVTWAFDLFNRISPVDIPIVLIGSIAVAFLLKVMTKKRRRW